MRSRRVIVVVVLALLLGAVLNVAVAVAASVFSPMRQTYKSNTEIWSARQEAIPIKDPIVDRYLPEKWRESQPEHSHARSFCIATAAMAEGFGLRTVAVSPRLMTPGVDSHFAAQPQLLYVLQSGWPRPVLSATWILDIEDANAGDATPRWSRAFPLPDWVEHDDLPRPLLTKRTPSRVIPAGILPLNLAINSVIYAILMLVPLVLWMFARRYRRLARGRCPQCGYDLVPLTRCPECGWTYRGAARE